ncbi:F-box and leucine-rich repeat protein 3 [Plakobranchus ocellatus]|uniref:F-box and leucine-rich repeat protein 3 n=1 Tax=Plakobranchus ocellatus TaxID=259542 RepID=A0AAV4AXJ9_9GAST|nr:F-box and leucine-rich repeat protein 3 [Plakobranchus ocellatus]
MESVKHLSDSNIATGASYLDTTIGTKHETDGEDQRNGNNLQSAPLEQNCEEAVSSSGLVLTHLPEVVLVTVMEYLSLKERYYLSLTCRLFHDLFSHPRLWQVAHISLLTHGERPSRNPYRWKLSAVMHHTMATIVQKFSHLFQHLSLELQDYVQPFDPNCRMLLQHLNTECRLESLSIKLGPLTSSDRTIGEVSAELSNYKDLPLVVGLIKNATRLKRFSLVSWPFHDKRNDDKDIFEAVLANEKLHHLSTFKLFFPELKNNQWTDRIPNLPSPALTLELVSHLKCLSHLALRSPMLSDQLILELSYKNRTPLASLQVLIMYARDSVMAEGYKVPSISATSWNSLRKSSPKLSVEYFVFNRVPPEYLGLMLQPEVRLSSINILTFGRCDAELVNILAERYTKTLRQFMSRCDSLSCDEALLKLVRSCDLSHLVYHGDVSYKTVEKIATAVKDAGQEMQCFDFKEKNIKTDNSSPEESNGDIVVARDDENEEYYLAALRSWHENEDERSKRLDALSEHVSQCLGYHWWPSDSK